MEKLSATFQSRQELWQSRIFAYRSSGLTAKDWCEKNQVSLSALRYWITKTNRSGEKDEPASSETVFAKLPSEEEIAKVMGNAPVTIFSNGLRIELSAGCPADMMSTLIRVLRSNA